MKTKGWRNIAIFLCAFVAVALEGKNDMPMLKWMGDEEARRATKNGAMKILREDRALSYGTGDNLLVHGDNLEALKALLPFYYYVNENGAYVAGAWQQDSKGWKYHAGSEYAKDITLNINGTAYTFDSNGYMK